MTATFARTRFAPSPTGYMHIGNLRTALYTYLIAKKLGGTFILRIEDTDQERYVADAVDLIIRTMQEVGLAYQEGPGVGGPYGPYVQSERRDLYQRYAEELVAKGGAYPCFCSKERLDQLREDCRAKNQSFQYDRHCRRLSSVEVKKLKAEGRTYVVRQAIPESGRTLVQDLIYGEIGFDNQTLEDGVLLKSDGFPTYNFANVVDDHLMQITHVVRGNEYISSSPKYDLIYQALGWKIPHYVHLPPIMRDATHKLSKRDGDASFEDLRSKGYLTAAIVNYIALLGWSPGNDRELFTMGELEEAFSLEGLSRSPAIFDPKKLRWMNGMYIRKLTPEQLASEAAPFLERFVARGMSDVAIAKMVHTRVELLSELPEALDFLCQLPGYGPEIFVNAKMKCDAAVALSSLTMLRQRFANLKVFDGTALHDAAQAVIAETGRKTSQVLFPLRAAMSGLPASWGGGVELAEILGRETCMERLDRALAVLG